MRWKRAGSVPRAGLVAEEAPVEAMLQNTKNRNVSGKSQQQTKPGLIRPETSKLDVVDRGSDML